MRHARIVFTSNRRQWLDFFPSFPSCRYTPISIETRHLFKYPPPFKFNTRLIKIFLEKKKKGIVRSSFFLHFSCRLIVSPHFLASPLFFFPSIRGSVANIFFTPKPYHEEDTTVANRRGSKKYWFRIVGSVRPLNQCDRSREGLGGGSCFIKTAQLVPFSGILLFTYRLTERLISSSRLSRTCASKRTNFSH